MHSSKATTARRSFAGSASRRSAARPRRSRRTSIANAPNGARLFEKPTSRCNRRRAKPVPRQRKTTAMHERLPNNSCDTHLHVFGDAKIYPVGNPNALYQPPQDCTFEATTVLHDAMGIDRAVFVQPTIYGTDHSLLHDVLKAAPKGKYRGVAIVDDSV